ncbi:MAG: phasin family protein [Comamonas sp.]|jgi:hypothetical protein|nr:phasin family protein [Comamonas sp.]
MSIQATPLNLFKANAELQLRIAQLMRENGHRWLAAVQQVSAEGVSETGAALEGLLRAEDWQSLASLPAEAFWRRFENRMSDAKSLSDIAVKNQEAFANGLQQALEAWQKAVADALRADAAPNLPSLPLQDVFKQWLAAWTPAPQEPAPAGARKAAEK